MSDDLSELIGAAPAARPGASAAAGDAVAPSPYQPPPEPQDNPAVPVSSARKTFAIWLVLIMTFAAVYALYSGPPGVRTWRDVVLGMLGVAWPFLLLLFVLSWLYRQLRGGQQLGARVAAAEAARVAGQSTRAIELARAVVHDYRRQPSYQAMARLHLGMALLHAGQLDEAAAEFAAVERTGGLQFSADARVQAVALLAFALATRGDLDGADRWLADLDRRLARVQPGGVREHIVANRALVAMIVAARRGQADAVIRVYDASVAQLECAVTVATMRIAWLVRAFAAARWDGPRELGAAEPWLRLVRGAPPAQLDFLATAWPELQAFRAAA
ncbi:MAG: hypothetical protein IPL61_33960 [Myxococcales bacterium]|nr:hypothetical protein [Myxococcales bacterium]